MARLAGAGARPVMAILCATGLQYRRPELKLGVVEHVVWIDHLVRIEDRTEIHFLAHSTFELNLERPELANGDALVIVFHQLADLTVD